VLPPRVPEVLLGHPFLEHAVEPPTHVEEPILDSPPHRTLERRPLVLVLELVVVADESLELLPPRKRLQLLSPQPVIAARHVNRAPG
jgi:hypothetical protein